MLNRPDVPAPQRASRDGAEPSGKPPVVRAHDDERRIGASCVRHAIIWFAVLAAGGAFAATALKGSWFFYDEWSMIDQVLHYGIVEGATASFNGHLWVFAYFVTWAQLSWFGVDSHLFVSGVLVVSLVLLHASVSVLLRSAGVPTLVSLLTGGLVTYLGPASQNVVFAIQSSYVLALALCTAAAAVVMARPPFFSTVAFAGLALCTALFVDSGIALPGLVLCLVVVGGRWPLRAAVATAGPAVLGHAWLLAAGDLGPTWPASVADRVSFALDLLLRAIGALTGLAEAGGALLAAAGIVTIIIGLETRAISGRSWLLLKAGLAAAICTTAAIAQTRAGLVGHNFWDFNRYLGAVAVPIVIAFAPALTDTFRHVSGASGLLVRKPWMAGAAPMMVFLAFLCGVGQLMTYRESFQQWNAKVRERARAAALVIRQGCPAGTYMRPDTAPAGSLSPQMTAELLTVLIERRKFNDASAGPADRDLVTLICRAS